MSDLAVTALLNALWLPSPTGTIVHAAATDSVRSRAPYDQSVPEETL
jgi:hypothetical protein